MASSVQFMRARGDDDLLARFVATAEQAGVDNASAWIQANMAKLVNTVVQDGQTVADVFAYAYDSREAALKAIPERAGINLGAVTDTHLVAAIEAIQLEQAPPVEEPTE